MLLTLSGRWAQESPVNACSRALCTRRKVLTALTPAQPSLPWCCLVFESLLGFPRGLCLFRVARVSVGSLLLAASPLSASFLRRRGLEEFSARAPRPVPRPPFAHRCWWMQRSPVHTRQVPGLGRTPLPLDLLASGTLILSKGDPLGREEVVFCWDLRFFVIISKTASLHVCWPFVFSVPVPHLLLRYWLSGLFPALNYS